MTSGDSAGVFPHDHGSNDDSIVDINVAHLEKAATNVGSRWSLSP